MINVCSDFLLVRIALETKEKLFRFDVNWKKVGKVFKLYCKYIFDVSNIDREVKKDKMYNTKNVRKISYFTIATF